MSIKEIYFKNERNDMFQFLPGKIEKCIEFGCSQGLFSKKIKELHGAECWGVDIDADSIKIAEKNLDKTFHGDALEVLKMLPENYFDCVICNDFLEHLPYPEIFIEKISNSMKNNSYLIASVPNVRSWSNVLEFILFKDWKYKESGILDKTHLRFYTLKSFKRFLTECGLKIDLFAGTRPNSSIIFKILNFFTVGFISDMRYMGIATRSVFKSNS